MHKLKVAGVAVSPTRHNGFRMFLIDVGAVLSIFGVPRLGLRFLATATRPG